jgi:serine protease Do
MKSNTRTLISALLLCASLPLHAQAERVTFSTGTGFYVTFSGHIITNAHVVKNCKDQRVFIQQDNPEPEEVELVAISASHDLALLKSESSPPNIGYLRSERTMPQIGERVMVLGYPEEYAATGEYAIEYSHVLALEGPNHEQDWMQFESSARRGNSGGPLLDASGNIIGVITAKLQFYQRNEVAARREVVGNTDAAIQLSALEQFLKEQHVIPLFRDQSMILSDGRNQEASSAFIVNILCLRDDAPTESESTPTQPVLHDLNTYYKP